MSNMYPGACEKKVIKTRPIHKTQQDDDAALSDYSEQLRNVRLQIDLEKEELKRIRDQQASVLEETNSDIEKAKADWEKEKAQLIEEAKQTGYTEGFEQGKQESLHDYQQLLEDANNIVESATKDYHATIEKSDETILDLAVHISRKIMNTRLTEEPATFLPLVHAAIKQIKDRSDITVHVNPAHFDLIMRQKDEILRTDDRDIDVSVYADTTLNEGSCLIEHPTGRVDAGIDTQLEELRKVLYDVSVEDG